MEPRDFGGAGAGAGAQIFFSGGAGAGAQFLFCDGAGAELELSVFYNGSSSNLCLFV